MEQTMVPRPGIVTTVLRFYVDGFRRMTLGRTLWKVIIIKLIIMFGVLKLFFFHDFLGTRFTTDEQRADYVLEQITMPARGHITPQGGERL